MIDISGLISIINNLPFLVGYISKDATFLHPLSSDKELEYIKLMQKGDLNAKNKLIEHNMRLVAHIAKKYNNTWENEDLISIGTIGLIKAINTFNSRKGTHLATYAARCIENEILMNIRLNKKRNNEISLDNPIGTDKQGNTIALIDVLGSDKDEVADIADKSIEIEKMKKLMCRCLTKREKRILECRYGFGMQPRLTQREIAKELDISRSYVSRIEKRAVAKLSKELAK
jgi:RNA polymerase sporulation-specific sigma factor